MARALGFVPSFAMANERMCESRDRSHGVAILTPCGYDFAGIDRDAVRLDELEEQQTVILGGP